MSQGGVISRPNTFSAAHFTGALAAALALGAGPASAQQMVPLMQRNDVRTGPSASYATSDGQLRFVFDRSGRRAALLRFEGDPEVHVLRPFAAAGGDELYRDETGDVALRITPHGGIVVYTRNRRTGAAVAEVGAVAPISPQALAIAEYQNRMRQLQAASARVIGRPVLFVAPSAMQPGPGAGLVLDAASLAAQSIANQPGVQVARVVIRIGPAPAARIEGDALDIQVAPQMGYAGRPSTTAIRAALSSGPAGPER
ncbi:MAG: DUF4908 domain-containing protein [Hyphomonadaceae bacterium]|nr:DUF4908 domain-containing protein [Hyphomonadaceae bacterium]